MASFFKSLSLQSFSSLTYIRFSTKEQTLFAKRMSFLVKAGVPLVECLSLIRTQTKSKAKGLVYDSVIKDVSNGQYLSTSLGKHKRLFGEFAINLIRVGENSGILSQNLAYLADELQKKHELQKKVIGTLIYPVFITIATLGVTSILTVFIFPKLMPIFTSLHVELPLTTRIMIAVSAYLQHWGILTLIGLIIVIILFLFVRSKFERVRTLADRVLLRIPLVGSIARSYNLTNFCRTTGLLLRSGITLTDALVITSETTKNRLYRNACAQLALQATRGEPVSRGLTARPDLYPDILSHMVAVGERTGNLSSTMTYLSELYEAEVEELTKTLSSSIEPVLMIVMGALVGLIAVSVITPIYSITQHLQPK
jgi:type IV pilus assembly protein PilC